jgi:hypothetical protein
LVPGFVDGLRRNLESYTNNFWQEPSPSLLVGHLELDSETLKPMPCVAADDSPSDSLQGGILCASQGVVVSFRQDFRAALLENVDQARRFVL